jgi:hypothetical protein
MRMANRVFLDASALRRLGDPHQYFTFQTHDEHVARSEALSGQAATNPNFSTDIVCFFRGFMPNNYGNYHVIFRVDEVFAHPANPPEWHHVGQVDSDGVGYTTTQELAAAGLV